MTQLPGEESLRAGLAALAQDRHDQAAWRTVFQRFWPFMVAVCARLVSDPDAAADLAQQAFIRIAEYAPFEDLIEPDAFRAYARVVCRRVVHAAYRKEGARQFVPLDMLELASDSLDPEQETSARMLQELVMRDLEADDQKLLSMTIAGYSLEDISKALGISASNAGVRIFRVRRRLRKWL